MMQKWLEKRRQFLWEAFQGKSFSFEEAAALLKEKMQSSDEQTNVILSELRKKGWLKAEFHPDDARKRIYTMESADKVMAEIISANSNKFTRSDLESLLKAAADLIRTRVDYAFILFLLFYKRISEKWQQEWENAYKEALEDGLKDEEAQNEAKNVIYHDFDVPEELLWDAIRKDPARLPENFSMALKALSEKNLELRDVFENVDFVQFTTNRENVEILRQLVELFSTKSLHQISSDMLGDAYEWILRYFAPQKAKEGEVYTPREVIKLLVEILDPKPGQSVYDPAAGSGGMLITSYQHVENEYGKEGADKLFLCGQEANYKTLALSKMNLYIHEIRNAQLSHGDTLLYPKFSEGEGIKTFTIVIANPPWNQDGYGEEILKKGEFWKQRFRYGFSPNQSADGAWLQHMIASADEQEGRVGIVIDNGCLFRSGKEKVIRTGIINDNLIEAIILLPEKLFYNTGAPGAIIILNKNKPKARTGKILFINASREYEQHPEVRKLNRLGETNINNIVEAYREYKEKEGFSKIVELDTIKEYDYNLNVTRYVFPEDEVEDIDVDKEWEELLKINHKLAENEKRIEGYLKMLKKENDDQ
ncbi:MAG: restriction endonuclease subunit M [Candidatus Fischerbacteria bacterium RBG_13_37_8]|uniref:site-specific DNA-methyltransferase (adenine-specific) n=1 Tax=Candidatus Fischerbacteria bacterium RBG_13_37_8 TaxID=1817863 RepID=A0A1F5VLN3_9BACT|nr:MAG: restriction endonuclease subunit M [Candidatus Fischerbacteria bacterium RBG_13_37_8]